MFGSYLPTVAERSVYHLRYRPGFLISNLSDNAFLFLSDVLHGGMRIAARTLRLQGDVVRLSVALCDPLAEHAIYPGDDWTQGTEVLGEVFSPASDTLVELLDLLDVRASEAVDRLLGIPHDE